MKTVTPKNTPLLSSSFEQLFKNFNIQNKTLRDETYLLVCKNKTLRGKE